MARGKKSVVLDLKSEQGRAELFRLCLGGRRDRRVVPARRRGALRHRLRRGEGANPRHRLLLDRAFGQDGAYPGRAAHDLALEA